MLISVLCITFDMVQNRPKADVCRKFKSMSIADKPNSGNIYQDQAGSCSPKSYDRTLDNNEGLMQYNYVRWMAGYQRNLSLITDQTVMNNALYCSIYCASINGITHDPNPSDKCYTKYAADGCGSSNLAMSYNSISRRAPGFVMQLLDDYIDGQDIDGLGHRRWMLSPYTVKTMFGAASNVKTQTYYGRVYTYYVNYFTMSTFDSGCTVNPPPETLPFYAWPPPGFVHSGHVYKIFSFSHENLRSNPSLVVKVDGVTKSTQTYFASYSYMEPPSLSFTFDGVDNLVNKRVDVKVTSGSNTWEYTIYPVDCSTWTEPSSDPSKPSSNLANLTASSPKTEAGKSQTSTSSGSNSQDDADQSKGNTDKNGKKNIPLIVGICVVVVTLIAIVVAVTFIIIKKRANADDHSEVQKSFLV